MKNDLRLRVIVLISWLAFDCVGIAEPPANRGIEKNPTAGEFAAKMDHWFTTHRHQLHTILIRQSDRQLYGRSLGGFSASRLHELQSATKTITALLIGIAIQDGLIPSIETPITKLLPDHASLLVGEKRDITLRHLLTMTSGLEWIDFGKGNSFEQIKVAEDSIQFVLNAPLTSKPGKKFSYNTGSSHLLSAIITDATSMPASDYAKKTLFEPLGIQNVVWPATRDGISQGGWGMFLAPNDMARIGQLILAGGRRGETQVVPQSFVDAATSEHVKTDYGPGYGFQMWMLNELGAEDVAAARGYGCQDIIVVQDLNAVIVFTGSIRFPEINSAAVRDSLKKIIIPELRQQASAAK